MTINVLQIIDPRAKSADCKQIVKILYTTTTKLMQVHMTFLVYLN